MTWFARLLIVLTSLAPILLVYGALLLDRGKIAPAGYCAAAAIGLSLLCATLLRGALRSETPANRAVHELSERDGDALAFLVAYALPLATAEAGKDLGLWSLTTFSVVVIALVWQQQLFHVNPLLGALGFYFLVGKSGDQRILILTRCKTLQNGNIPTIELSPYFWLHRG